MPCGVTALIVPQEKVLDFIDGTLRSETPEEYVRQAIEKSLVREDEYGRDEMRLEFPVKIGTASKRCDIVFFPDGAPQNKRTSGPPSNARLPRSRPTTRAKVLNNSSERMSPPSTKAGHTSSPPRDRRASS